MASKQRFQVLFVLLVAGMVFSCTGTKSLPAGDALYRGSKIEIRTPENPKKKKQLVRLMQNLTRPRTNRSFLGIRFKLWVYTLAGHPKNRHGLAGWLKYSVGEPPVLLSELNLGRNVQVLQSSLENKGYFQAEVKGDTLVKKGRAFARYTADTKLPYKVREVRFEGDSTALQRAILKTAPGTLLKKGENFDLDQIKKERNRIDDYLKENGFYFFNPDFLIIWADSNQGNHEVNLYVRLKPGLPGRATEPYKIRDIFIYSDYSLREKPEDTARSKLHFFDGYYIADPPKKYDPLMFDQAMMFNSGDLYNRTDHNQSLNRLVNLGIFRFVKNRFDAPQGLDSPRLDTYYYLTPFPKKSLRIELNGNTKSDNSVGSKLSVDWRNRNCFRGGELFSVTAYGGFDIQFSGQFKGYNTLLAGIDLNLAFPRFLVPFFDITSKGAFMPKTNLELGYDLLNKDRLYTLNSFRSALSYVWKEDIHKEHKLSPLSINYVQPVNVTRIYLDSLKYDSTLLFTIQKQFVIGPTYGFVYNGLLAPQPASGFYFSGNLDLSGNLLGLVTGADARRGKIVEIAGAPFSQFVKAETEFRFYQKLSDVSVLANRLDLGFGYPYGNSLSLPFIKQFYSGGNNSLRAFRCRSVGPGTYLPAGYGVATSFLPDQSGDIKLEGNTELRTRLFSIVEGAAFIDAGNVWLYNLDTLKPGGQFGKDFLKQLAVGAGLGLRFNISILILRLDVAIPLRKPWLPGGQRWVFNQIAFGDGNWRRANMVYNLGIGYPF